MNKTDLILKKFLTNNIELEKYIDSAVIPRCGLKKYQIILETNRNLGFIFQKQELLICVVENIVPNFCKFIGETEICPLILGGKG